MFRYERPQNGRQRQFNQLGVEVLGSERFTNNLLPIKILNIKSY